MADCVGVGLLRNFCFRNFAKSKIILSKFRETQNFDKIILIFAKFEENFAKLQKLSFAATLCRTGVRGGGGPVQPWRILRANADCTLFGFPLYRFPFCHL